MKFLLIICLVIFGCFNSVFASEQKYKVIKIIDGDTLYIDFNNNNIPEKNEKVRINGIDTFETKTGDKLNSQMKYYKLNEQEALKLGYLAKEFAKHELLNKNVTVKFSAPEKGDLNNRLLLSIYYDNDKNYEIEILKNGLAVVYQKSNLRNELIKYENIKKLKKNAIKAKELNLVYFNYKNKKYHKLNCKYVKSLTDWELINLNKTNNLIPASCCRN